jgi:hypothetical protein
MFRGDRRLRSHAPPQHRGRAGGLALIVTRGFSFRVETKSTQARLPAGEQACTGAHQRRGEPTRVAAHQSALDVASQALPTPRRWAPHVRRPGLWVIRCLRNVPPHIRAKQPGLSGDGPRSAIFFTIPKLTRKPPPARFLPWSPYVATAPHRDVHQSCQPTNFS